MAKTIAVIFLVLALMATCGLSIVVTLGAASVIGNQIATGESIVRVLSRADTPAEVVETQRVRVGREPTIDIDSDAGDVSVTAADVRTIEIEMTKQAWGSDDEEAALAAKALDVQVDTKGDTVTITFRRPQRVDVASSSNGTDNVTLVITVPLKTDARLLTHFGDVSVQGTQGTADVSSSYGDIKVMEVTGAVSAQSEFGDVELSRIDGGANDVAATTSFGDVTLDNVKAHSLTFGSQNGDLVAREITIQEALTAETSFGDVRFNGTSADTVDVKAQNGAIDLNMVEVQRGVTVESSFGDVDMLDVEAASIVVTTGGGAMNLDRVAGKLDLEGGFGDIEVRANGVVKLDAENQHGAVRFHGRLDDKSSHTIHANFGDVLLEIPERSNFDIELETGFGTIRCDLPVTVAGEVDEEHLTGTIGDGGPLLKVTSQSGDVEIQALREAR